MRLSQGAAKNRQANSPSAERALIFCQGEEIQSSDLPLEACMPLVEGFEPVESSGDMSMETMEQVHIRKVLENCQWNRSHAARELGIGYNTLWRKMKKYGITQPE